MGGLDLGRQGQILAPVHERGGWYDEIHGCWEVRAWTLEQRLWASGCVVLPDLASQAVWVTGQ